MRIRPAWPAPTRESAVLVLIYPDASGEARLVLTERPATVTHHAGEVSFPGGSREAWDDSAETTALREAAEEVGLNAADAGVRVIGRLEEVAIGPSGFRLTPVLALADREPGFTPDPHEVAAILTPPLASFLPDAPIHQGELERDGWRLRFGAYEVEGHTVWGATARILGQLGAIVAVPER
ncbi:MAG TPA: CoA pyrophosphatase [Candidatus Sulfotelmatobacter sp.]|jgi:8-oxo-dGTP pyrophosphatase MutT (NUDIX family)|nr:CoA pyrophosphatase [Candidatus Sulfotelmatobacter sp.]